MDIKYLESCISSYRFIPESPRWLLVQNKMEDAMNIIGKIAAGNGRHIPDHVRVKAKVPHSTFH